MKVLIKQFLGTNHSWSVCGWGIATAMIELGHDVHLFSTDGIKCLPPHLKNNIIGYTDESSKTLVGRSPDSKYDSQISYTCMKNFPYYLNNGPSNRFGIWCYEFSGSNALPLGFAKHYKSVDKLIPPSVHAKQVFLDSGVPESVMQVIPHGISNEFLIGTDIYPLKTDKKFKVLCNIAQPHRRKNIDGTFEAWGRAFTKKDDVVLVVKASSKKPEQSFEVNFNEILQRFKKKYPDHADIIVIDQFIPDISSLYRSCNAVLSLSLAESFLFPALEGLACGKIVLVSGAGGQIDYCTDNNSILIQGKNIYADPRMLYWQQKSGTTIFEPDLNHAADKLQFAFKNESELLNKFSSEFSRIRKEYTWGRVANSLIELCK